MPLNIFHFVIMYELGGHNMTYYGNYTGNYISSILGCFFYV